MPTNALRRKEVFALVPEGIPVTREWLMEHDFSRHALDNLVKSKLLESLAKGVYVRVGSRLTWQAIVYSLQWFLRTDLTIGGLTALEMQGFAHYLPLSPQKSITLYGKDKIPSWVNTALPDINFVHHSDFDGSPMKLSIVHHLWKDGINLNLSSPERAYLEVLDNVPVNISFEHADELLQSLTTLSPKVLQMLLELSANVKVNRLFFWFAERYNFPWLKRLNPEMIKMGSGNRMLVKGGKLNKKYRITVPSAYEP
jgi:hypothetical protein